MTARSLTTMVVIATVFTSTPVASAQQATIAPQEADRFIGTWDGVFADAENLRLRFSVERDSPRGLRAALVSIDQGGVVIPATLLTTHGDTIMATLGAAHATYIATITPRGDSLRGMFVQQGNPRPLILTRSATTIPIPVVTRPQDPKPPFPYRAEDVSIASAPGVRLAGTMIIPAGAGPFPAVVFVTGSGPQDRDESLLGHRPFLIIADYLARRGIASLRYDDRGIAKSTGSFATATSVDFAVDAEAAVRFARGVKGVAPNHVGILGHSEGGLIGPMVAARTTDVAFLVLMAGPGIRGDSIALLQTRLIAAAAGAPAKEIDAADAMHRRLLQALNGGTDSADAATRLAAAKGEILASMPEDRRIAARARLDQVSVVLLSPWNRYFMRYDPTVALRNVRVPVLALGGTLDLQVPYKENLSGIEAALKAGGNHDYRVVELPGLNHLFQTATTGSPSEYAKIDETVSPMVLELIASWITQHSGRS